VKELDMSSIRLVSLAEFHDADGKLVTSGIDGTFLFDFDYRGKYDPHHAAIIDPEGKSIDIALRNKLPMEKMVLWAKGLRVDAKNGVVASWGQTRLAFNCLRTGAVIHSYKDMTPVENHITSVYCVLNPYKYFVAGTL
jgi:WD40 repeat protein